MLALGLLVEWKYGAMGATACKTADARVVWRRDVSTAALEISSLISCSEVASLVLWRQFAELLPWILRRARLSHWMSLRFPKCLGRRQYALMDG